MNIFTVLKYWISRRQLRRRKCPLYGGGGGGGGHRAVAHQLRLTEAQVEVTPATPGVAPSSRSSSRCGGGRGGGQGNVSGAFMHTEANIIY